MAFNNHLRNEIKTEIINAMDMSETYQATASIQLRTHPTHATINFSEMGKKLLESARNGDTDDVLELINTGAPFTTDWLGASPLHYAAQYGHVDTVETLLRSGIAKDARTKIDRTALHVAAQEGFLETVNILVNYGCDVDAKDMLKMTPLHWAVQRGHREIMEVLLNHGADVKIVNKFDKTPIDIAYSTGHSDYVPLLQNFKPKAKPVKINPVENTVPIRLMKTHPKSRSKTPNMNRSLPNKLAPNIKQEIDDDTDMKPTTTVDYKIIKRESMPNGQILQYSGKTGPEKLVINSFKDQQNTSPIISNNNQNININNNNSMSNKKIYTINPQTSNIVLVSNSTGSTKSDQGNGQIKVMSKKQVFTEIKNKNQTFQVDNLNFPFGFTKQNPPQVIKRFVISNPNQSTSAKDDEIKKLSEENNKLKRELEEYKSLIISKDLEIERLKKQKINNNNNNSNNNNNNTTTNINNNSIHHDEDEDDDDDD